MKYVVPTAEKKLCIRITDRHELDDKPLPYAGKEFCHHCEGNIPRETQVVHYC